MTYANDKLYKGYVRRNMAEIVKRVKPRQIVPYLPCLTDIDREEIEAKKQTCGDNVATQHLLDCLKRRENWPEEFISALEACEHTTMAAEIRAQYNSLKGQSSTNPPPLPATVVQAHVHPAPSANQFLSLPESVGNSPAAVAPPVQAAAPPELVAQASPPPEAPVQPESSPGPEAAKAAPSTDLASQPTPSPRATVAPQEVTPPPSPQTPHQRATTPPPDRERPVHQEPEENSESDLLAVPGDEDVILEETSTVDSEVSEVNDEVTPEPEAPVLQPEMAAPCQPDPTVQTETLEVSPPKSPAPTQPDPVETPESIPTIIMPEKLPVQDTTPPADKVITTILVPEEISKPIATKVSENSQHTETVDTTSPPLDGTDGPCASLSGDDDDDDDDDACLSKPTPLLSIQQNNETPHPPASEVEPCSTNTDRLQFSDSATDSEPVAQVAIAVACSGLASDPETMASPPPCQENGIVEEPVSFPHNEPEENCYESPCQSSLGEQEVLVNVVHVTEEPSIQNLDGQTLKSSCHSCDDQTEEVLQGEACVSEEPQAQILNVQAASALNKEPDSALRTSAVTVSIANAPSSENCHPLEPGAVEALLEPKPQGQQDPEKKAPANSTSSNTKYFLTAAGVGACALFFAWKLKKKQDLTL